jgi:glycosyltransferase involved in cell wall biosynthesis
VISIPNSIPEVSDNLTDKRNVILHVGRIVISQKRSDLLLDFWESTYKSLYDWEFVIIGDGPYLEELKTDLERRKLPRVILKGYQEPEKYYKMAKIFMMPSAFEGFPNTILEAQSYGCLPVVFNSYAALEWIVHDKEDSFLISPFDTIEMSNTIMQIANDEGKLLEMQKESLINARKFTIDKVGQHWLSLFSSLK